MSEIDKLNTCNASNNGAPVEEVNENTTPETQENNISVQTEETADQMQEESASGPTREEMIRMKKESAAINQYLNSYNVAKVSKASGKTTNSMSIDEALALREEQRQAERNKKGNIILYIAAAIITIAAAVSLVYIINPTIFSPKTNDSATVMDDIYRYQTYAAAATEASPGFFDLTWGSSHEALEDLANLINPGLPEQYRIKIISGTSYATAGKDPWGKPYYITAMQLGENQNEYRFDFYITCSGENQMFNTTQLLLDKDDISETLLSMPPYTAPSSETSFVDDLLNMDHSSNYISVPITFDTAGGTGGTALVNAYKGKVLPDVEVPTKEGYVFEGYYEGSNGAGIQYYDREGTGCFISPFDEGTTLFAYWTVYVAPPVEETPEIITDPNDPNYDPTLIPDTEQEGEADTSGDSTHATQEDTPSTPAAKEPTNTKPATSTQTKPAEQTKPATQTTPATQTQKPAEQTKPETPAQPTQPADTRLNCTIRHYVMDTNGYYPQTPTAEITVKVEQGTTLMPHNYIRRDLLTDGITYDHVTHNGKVVTAAPAQEGSILALYYSRAAYAVSAFYDEGLVAIEGVGVYYVGQQVTLTAISDIGHVFSYWEGDMTGITNPLTFTMPANALTLYAKAATTLPSHTITFNPLGGSIDVGIITVSEGCRIGKLPIPTREGYLFTGWYTEQFDGEAFYHDQIYPYDKDILLYARWVAAPAA